MKIRNIAGFATMTTAMAWFGAGCLDLQTSTETGGQGGTGQGGGGADTSSSTSGNGTGGMGMTSSSGQAGSGAGGPCSFGETMECYQGPPTTKFSGVCQPGQIVCDPSGTWGDCNGAILPDLEPCDSAQDLNCDGRMGCQGVPDSNVLPSGDEDEAIVAITIGKGANGWDGPVYGTGYRNATVDAAANASSAEVLLVKREPSGTLTDLSNRFFIDSFGNASGRDVAVDSNGNLYVVGTYQGASLNVGGQGLKTAGSATLGFLASFDPSGNLRFAKDFGSTGNTEVKRVKVDAAGNVYISGKFDTSIDFGNNLVMSNGGFDGFVAAYSTTGALVWRKTWSGTGDESVNAIAISPDGALYAAADFTNAVTVGGGPVFMTEGGMDALISKHSTADGTTQWYNEFGDTGDITITDMDTRGGDIAVLGAFRGKLALGGFNYTSNDGPNLWDIIVATLEPNGGAVASTFPFLSDGIQVGTSVSIDPLNDIVVGGYFMQTLPLGGPLMDLTTGGDVNAFVVKFSPTLAMHWAHGYGNSLTQAFLDAAVDPTTGATFVSGGMQGIMLGFGVQPPQSNGGFDAIIGRMTN